MAVQSERKDVRARVARLVRGGDIEGAIAEYARHLEKDPEDHNASLAVAELCVQAGDDDNAVSQFTRVADAHYNEGFFAKAAALYKKVIRIRPDDHALLSLTDIAARQDLLLEAKQYLMQLEQHRRDRGDLAGADECLASLDALVAVKIRPEESEDVSRDSELDAASGAIDAAAAPVPAEAAVQDSSPDAEIAQQSGEPDTPDEAPGAGVEMLDEVANPAEPPGSPATPAVPRPSPRAGSRATRLPGAGQRRKVKPLQAVFNELRAQASAEDDAAVAHERFDLAQYHLRDGDEPAAMIDLQEAARSPVLRFAASAQLGRLLVAQGELPRGVEWLERAVTAPPVSPDEGLAVLYELGDALQQLREPARALAVFLELNAQRRGYRDVAARIASLSDTQSREEKDA